MNKNTKEITKPLLIVAAVVLLVVTFAVVKKTFFTDTETGPVEERTLPEKLDAADSYEQFIEKGLTEREHISVAGTTYRTTNLRAYEYRRYEYKTDEIVLYFNSGTMVASQITDVTFW